MKLASCGSRCIPVGRLVFEEEIFNPLIRDNLRGLSTWQLVAESQNIVEQVEDWESIRGCGGMVEEELRQAMRFCGLIAAEIKRRSQFEVSAKAQAANVEVRALKELSTGNEFVELVGHYVDIVVVSGSYKFSCPIHGDDHPSGQLYPTEGKWWCYGCNRGGDVFDFLMIYGRLTFGEAVSLLGKVYGLTVGRGNGAS